MRKGQASYPFSVTESVLSFVLILGIINGVAIRSGDFIARETVDLQVDRIDNAALALSSVREGHIEIELDAKNNYFFKYGQGNVTLNYTGVVKSQELSSVSRYDSISGPSNYENITEELCIKKTQESEGFILEFKPEGC